MTAQPPSGLAVPKGRVPQDPLAPRQLKQTRKPGEGTLVGATKGNEWPGRFVFCFALSILPRGYLE
jgi:hypothetical protein